MERIPRAIYTKELREEAVKLVREGGLNIPEVGRRLSIAPSTIRYWVKASREGKLGEVGRQQRPLTEVEMELARVKREMGLMEEWGSGYKRVIHACHSGGYPLKTFDRNSFFSVSYTSIFDPSFRMPEATTITMPWFTFTSYTTLYRPAA